MEIPPTIYVTLGAVLAALIAGFFSFLSFIGAKENKVSEFRLAWIDGLRKEIAEFTAASQELNRIELVRLVSRPATEDCSVLEEWSIRWHKISSDPYRKALESLACIQMRLNPRHVEEVPNSLEAKLMSAVISTRDKFNSRDFYGAYEASGSVAYAAAPLLKSTWDLVRNGEPGYQTARKVARRMIVTGVVALAVALVSVTLNELI